MGKLCTTGKARQAIYDAIKKCREEGEAWVTFKGKRLKLVDVDKSDIDFYPADWGLVKFRGEIILDVISNKDGLRLCGYSTADPSYIQWTDILAWVPEIHDRKSDEEGIP